MNRPNPQRRKTRREAKDVTIVTEEEFRQRVDTRLRWMVDLEDGAWKPRAVMGPGRSGAIAAVYVSHFLKVPFIPYGTWLPADFKGFMIVDTAMNSGRTIRKALRKYDQHWPTFEVFYHEPPRVKFWYEEWEDTNA